MNSPIQTLHNIPCDSLSENAEITELEIFPSTVANSSHIQSTPETKKKDIHRLDDLISPEGSKKLHTEYANEIIMNKVPFIEILESEEDEQLHHSYDSQFRQRSQCRSLKKRLKRLEGWNEDDAIEVLSDFSEQSLNDEQSRSSDLAKEYQNNQIVLISDDEEEENESSLVDYKQYETQKCYASTKTAEAEL